MRSRKAFINMMTGIFYELVTVICGLILPRLILSHFGSSYNGITSSISQFLSGIALLKAGIGSVTIASLYKPIANKDIETISSIVKTTEQFMRKIACIFVVLVGLFACIYPIWINDEFEWFFSFSLIIILSISTFAQYFFGIPYQMLLKAGQQQYVVHGIHTITNILNTVFASVLILAGFSIHVVKLASAMVFVANPIIVNIYARKKYQLNSKAKVNTQLIQQRWDAFAQALAFFVHNNTDLIVLTIFTNLREVSVYTVYSQVTKNIYRVVTTCVSSFGAAFGDMLAKKQYTLLEKNLRIFELIVFSLVSILYTITGVMIVPYAALYTKGITDVNYSRPLFAFLITLSGAISCFRIPYQTIVESAGHFKQNRNGALFEAGMNITISVISVIRFGLVGVLFGTVAATLFRSIQYSHYLSKNLIPRSMWHFWGHVITCGVTALIVSVISAKFLIPCFHMTVESWLLTAIMVGILTVAVTVIVDLLVYRETFFLMVQKIEKMFSKKKT